MWLKNFNSRPISLRSHGLRWCSTGTESGLIVTNHTLENQALPESVLAKKKLILEKFPTTGTSKPRQAWVESLSTSKWVPDASKVIQLHPDVWAVKPRSEFLNEIYSKLQNLGWNCKTTSEHLTLINFDWGTLAQD